MTEKTQNFNSKIPVVIFGAGNAGIAAMENVSAQYNVIAFCDNDATKVNTLLNGKEVISAAKLLDYPFERILIASEFFEKIKQQLLDMGIHHQQIQVLAATQIKSLHFGEDQQVTNNAIAILLLVCATLKKAGVNYYVDAGTLLGIYRDGALIPWDDDLDIAINSNQVAQTQAAISDLLPQLQQLTQEPWLLNCYEAKQDFGAVKSGNVRSLKLQPQNVHNELPLMDFFVKYVEGNVMDYTLSSRGIRMPSEHLLQLDTMRFAGADINIPSNTELYLERHYGDWRTPKKDWNLSELKNATVY
ncbi:LicD family protein [Alteromonadaceae bacterium BrNp21-10]|nr:LicD family protein [Alteromonadaceae bacterium BrNp21-10]